MDIWGFSSLVHSHNISFLEQIYKTYKFLEVECLGFCFHWDPKRKSLPQAAASALPLFIGEGELRKGLHVGLSRTLISKHLGAPPWSFQGGGVPPVPLLDWEMGTTAHPTNWKEGWAHLYKVLRRQAGTHGPSWGKVKSPARRLLSPNHHVRQTRGLWGKWEIVRERRVGRKK